MVHAKIDATFVAVKALKAWFLADSAAMNLWLKRDDFFEAHPEQTNDKPWQRLKDIAKEYELRGTGASKVAFAKRMIKHWGFDVRHAANHQRCESAKNLVRYFTEDG